MTNGDQPAAPSGGPRNVSSGDQLPDQLGSDLPKKLRVHELAKLLGLASKEVLAALAEIGSTARSASSTIDRETALRVAASLLPDPAEPGGDSAEEIEDGALAAPLAPVFAPPQPLFLPPQVVEAPRDDVVADEPLEDDDVEVEVDAEADVDDDDTGASRRRRRRGRRGRGRGKAGADDYDGDDEPETEAAEVGAEAGADGATDPDDQDDADGQDDDQAATRRRRRRRRRKAADADGEPLREDDPPNTVVHVRDAREVRQSQKAADGDDGVQGVRGSTRLEAKRQRRRDGREAGRRRPPILSEAEFLARRESVERIMVVREHGKAGNGSGGLGLVQIAVLEDGVLVEHFVTSGGTSSLAGNVYLGRVQNVLPSMEAAFVDIGRGRNAVLYAGEVDWDAAGLEGKARKIEQALSTGDSVLVQVTKDPVGHKGARLTTQISLPGRFLVYVPGGGATGISRKLPDTERKRLKDILRRIVPDDAGVIIRTASEGVSEDALGRDVRRLQAQWEVIKTRSEAPRAQSPQLLYEEPDLLIKVVRDLFTEDFSELVVQGGDALDTIEAYVEHVAPDLRERLRRHVGTTDVFTEYRIDEQILKALDRKVWLPSGGYLVIDRTEAMTVIDVNTGKFTGSGGNLEETVTRNNLEAAEEIVRQLRLRDIGGIIVIDFIDMVLESNRDLVLRRLTECLGRDRTRHQVAEVTSLGLVQMTRKRVGSGLLEAFSTPCEHCRGRGVVVSTEPVEPKVAPGAEARPDSSTGRRGGRSKGRAGADAPSQPVAQPAAQAVVVAEPAAVAAPTGVPVAAGGLPDLVDEPHESRPAKRQSGRRQSGRQPADKAAADVPAEVLADQPAIDQPLAEQPAAQRPPIDQPATDQPATDQPATDQPATDQPATDQPATDQPATEQAGGKPERTRVRRRSGRGQAEQPEQAQPADQPAPEGRPDAAAPPPAAHQPAAAQAPQAEPAGPATTEPAAAQPAAPQPAAAAQPPLDGAVQPPAAPRPRRRRAASRPAGPPASGEVSQAG